MDEEIRKYERVIYVSMYYFFKTADRSVWQRIATLHNCDMEDLIQIGRITVWKALQSFDEDLGDIGNYMISAIKNEIQGELIRLRRLNKRGVSDKRREGISVQSLNAITRRLSGDEEELQELIEGEESFCEGLIDDLDFYNRVKELSEDEQQVVKWTLQGHKLSDMSRLFGIPRDTLKYRRLQAAKKLTGLSDSRTKTQNQDTFIRLYLEGKDKHYIMEHLDIKSETSYRTRLYRYRKKGLLT